MGKVLELAKMIDHSILHPTLTDKDLEEGCALAKEYNVASVCVKPYAVARAAELLKGSDVIVGCVIGFPHGNSTIHVKVFETEQAISDGAKEIDMVVNNGKVLQNDWEYVEKELKAITDACHKGGAVVKVIFENDFLPDDSYKIKLCEICTKVGADYVKTSSGFGFVKQANGDYNYTGATIEDLKLMREHSGANVNVKAAGGVRTLDQLIEVQATGAKRCGATATKAMLDEAKKRFGDE